MQPFGGAAEVQFLGNGHEIAQLTQFHEQMIGPLIGNA
jgi:hypothetical protein